MERRCTTSPSTVLSWGTPGPRSGSRHSGRIQPRRCEAETLGQCKGSTRAWFREKTPFTPASAASSRTASARGGAQLREEPREISELVMRVEPAGIGEHPDSCHPYDLALQAQRGLGAIEGGAVRHDPEHGEIARAIAAHL